MSFSLQSVVSFITFLLCGALLLAVFSVLAKLQMGADVLWWPGYLFPSFYGAIVGSVAWLWSARLQHSLQEQTRLREQYYDLFENASDLIQSISLDGSVLFVNRAWRDVLGYSAADLEKMSIFDVIVPEDRSHCRERLEALLDGQRLPPAEVTFLRKDGGRVLLEGDVSLRRKNDKPHSVRAIYRNISERKAAEVKIHQLAYYDGLTGLPNRTLLQDRLAHAIADARRFGHHLGLIFIDLDQFKKINDSLGHSVGDLMLIEVARRLRSILRENDTAARMGGDEFVVILSGFHNVSNVPHIAEKILLKLSEPYSLAGHQLTNSGSLGIALYPQDGEGSEELMRNADLAMYAAKNERGNNFKFYSQQMNDNAVAQLKIENDLRTALQQEQLVLHYQPQIDWSTKTICGVEALLRWQHPERGLLLPEMFIPAAEDTGIIVDIGSWVVRQACLDISTLSESQLQQGLFSDATVMSEMNLSINCSGRQFDHPQLVEEVIDALHISGLPAERLELEITETVLMERPDDARKLIERLAGVGVRFALDDFGTGYSSLAYLKHFPVHRLKIDQSFLVDIMHDNNNAAIVETIISMARNMGLEVIAEGVETVDQVSFLYDRQCSVMQGFVFAEPMPLEQLSEYLSDNFVGIADGVG